MPCNSSGTKLRRKVISLDTKIKILDRLAAGQRVSLVGKQFDLNEATVRTIKKNEEAVRRAVCAGTDLSCKSSSYTRDFVKAKMEKALLIWIEDNAKKKIPISGNAIKQTALKMYRNIQETDPETSKLDKRSDFSASTGWMRRFLNRYGLHNIKALSHTKGEEEFYNCNLLGEGMHDLIIEKTEYEITDPLCNYEAFEEQNDNTKEDIVLNTDFIKKGRELARKLGDHFLKYDTNKERSRNFERELKSIMSTYSQPLITEFFVKKPAADIGNDSRTKRKRSFKESYF